MAEIKRPYGDLCNNCPLSKKSELLALEIPTNGHPEAEVAKIIQSCGWEYWLKRIAGVRVERVVKEPQRYHTFTAKVIVGKAPKDCPLPY